MTPRINSECALVLPARNEPEIGNTVQSIADQTRRPAHIVIVLNNCTDGGETRELAVRAAKANQMRVTILEMDNNPHMKAGALNFGYEWIRTHLKQVKFLIQMDADSILAPDFVERTLRAFHRRRNRDVAALSCSFNGKSGLAQNRYQAVLMWAQRLEYTKYHDSGILRNISVVSGTGCALRVRALEEIRLRRGYVWNVSSLVEDYELTIQLRLNGWGTRKSELFRVYTDLMPSLRMLVNQRERWQRGTNDELRRFKWNRVTAMDILKQWFHALGLVGNIVGWTFVALAASAGHLSFSPVILVLLGLVMLKQGYHARSMGWPTVILAATLIPDALYGVVRNYWWLKALVMSYGGARKTWA